MMFNVSRQRGVSLIEALVAMAVMGFGMLGVLGLQSSLRGNADVSKQRSEAVRIAQQTIETARAFSVLDVTSGASAYDAVVSAGPTSITPANANATFSLQTTVTTLPAAGSEAVVAPHKRLVVNVSWVDRNNETQMVRLATMISATAPETAAALGAPADASPIQRPAGRHPVIPQQAVNLGNGTSSFAPPNAATGVSWTFNNTTGYITQVCTSSACTDFQGRLISGYVNFATGSTAPTAADAENPTGAALMGSGFDSVSVRVATTVPAVGTVTCFQPTTFTSSTYVAYYCAVPVSTLAPFAWSGRVELVLPAGLSLATSVADNDANRYRVCRYTPSAARVIPHLVVPNIRNVDHPLDYSQVSISLAAQNFLVIRAGSGTGTAFGCPADDTSTADQNGSTWHHQPST